MFYILKVTINDVTKDLIAAKKFQRLIGDHKNYEQKQRQRTAQVSLLFLKTIDMSLFDVLISHVKYTKS